MKAKFFYSLLILITVSCVTQKQKERILKDCPIKIKDSISIKEIEKIIEIPLPAKEVKVYLESPCDKFCDSLGNLKNFEIKIPFKGGSTTLTANKEKNTLEAKTNIDKDSTQVKVKEKTVNSYRQETVSAKCEKEHKTKWTNFTEIGFYIYTLFLVLFLLVKHLKNRFF